MKSTNNLDTKTREGVHQEGWREALIATLAGPVVSLILILLVRGYGFPTGGIFRELFPKMAPKVLPAIVFIIPPLFSFVIFYKFSNNFKKSVLVGILGFFTWIIVFFILLWIAWEGMMP